MKFLVLNGPNLNLLGVREPGIYGAQTYDQLVAFIQDACAQEGVEVVCRQSNHEGVLVDLIQGALGSVTLEVSLEKAKTTLLCVLLMQAFPLYAFAVSRKAVRRDTLFWLTLGLNAVSVLEFLFLGESGRRAGDGNFGWGMMGAAMMSWVVGLSAYFQARSAKALSRFKALGGDLLLGWHLISGVYYIVYLFTSGAAL